ncbi:MAG: archease [Chloroflexi bacterium]|nr:archease [Chloroflexota bacterium]
MANYEIVDHTADWALRVWGMDFADLLLNAAVGMNELMLGKGISVPATESRQAQPRSLRPRKPCWSIGSATWLILPKWSRWFSRTSR